MVKMSKNNKFILLGDQKILLKNPHKSSEVSALEMTYFRNFRMK